MYLLGIDGGGSSTRSAVIDRSREVIGRGEAGPSNHYAVGAEIAAQNCASAAALAIEDAKRLLPSFQAVDIAAWGFGLAGVRRAVDSAKMHAFLSEICGKPFVLDTDVVAAHAGAFAGDPGIVLSAGTGAICFGADEYGEKFYADGWGPLLGDEGSGYWMGVEALKAACRSFDGRGPQTRLAGGLLDALNLRDPDELVLFAYSAEATRDKIAALSQVVLQLAETGSQEASDIRGRAVAFLTRSVLATARALLTRRRERAVATNPNVTVPPLDMAVALRGGLFDDDFLRASLGFSIGESMVELKRDYLPVASWRIVKPHYDAAVGAALLASLAV